MTGNPCPICHLPAADRDTIAGLTRTAAANLVGCTEWAVRRHREQCSGGPATPAPQGRATVELGATDGTIDTGPMDAPIRDLDDALRLLGVDPQEWQVVGDTVRVSRWETPYRDADGEMVSRWNHALRARIVKRVGWAATADDLDRLRAIVHTAGTPRPRPGKGALVVALADLQLGKAEGGGVEATLVRFRRSLDQIVDRATWLADRGDIGRIVLAQMGDPVEGCGDHYTNQTFTVELNQRQQLNLVLDVLTEAIAALSAVCPVDVVTVHSNHGEWTRNGGRKPITDDADTADGFLADTLARVFTDPERVRFHTPDDEDVMTVEAGGVPIAFTHGHKASGGMEKWIAGQNTRLVYRRQVTPTIWVTAHFHHLRVQDQGPYYWFQCPSLDGGSKWFEDSSGKWSTPGVLTFVATDDVPKGWYGLEVC